mgnify:CR=1 FL=1
MKKKYKTFLVTGGTGGHVFPSLCIYDYLKSKGVLSLIITDLRGTNYINKNQYKTKKIFSSHLQKRNFEFFKGIFFLIIGFFQFIILLFKERPNNIITFGGYSSFSAIFSTIILKKFFNIKLYFHEQNSVLGKVNRMFISGADNVFLSFKKTEGIRLKYNYKLIYSGLPTRVSNIKKISRNYKNIGKNLKLKILFFGGSQGASNLSKNLINSLVALPYKYQKLIEIIIQLPKQDIYEVDQMLKKTFIKYQIKSFYKNIINEMKKTDLCICRAGASTIFELIQSKTPAILIPLPASAKNHQYKNAKFLSAQKAAIIIEENKLLGNKLSTIIKKIIRNRILLKNIYLNLNKIKSLKTNEIIYNNIFNRKN